MLLAYLDEARNADAFYVTAVLIEGADAIPLAKSLDAVVMHAQETYGGVKDAAELHGHALVSGREDWHQLRGRVDACVDVYIRAVEAIANCNLRIYIRGVELAGFKRRYGSLADPHGAVLAFVLERVQLRAEQLDEVALVIADEVRGKEDVYRRAVRSYQKTGTFGWKAIVLDRIADTIHFAPSKSSRLLQAADLVAYAHLQSLRPHADPRAQAAYEQLWRTLDRRGVRGKPVVSVKSARYRLISTSVPSARSMVSRATESFSTSSNRLAHSCASS